MTKYEWFRWLTFKFMTTHFRIVRNDLISLVKNDGRRKELQILDVGGRKSPYTIGINAEVTLLDIPQETHTQQQLHLGFNERLQNEIRANRSNIKELIFMDMTKSTLKTASYDAVVCVEVIEHVQKDDDFVKNISEVIKQGGWAYFTTPNGDYIKNVGPDKNPDHVRHYTKRQLKILLEKYFDKVNIHYAVKTGKYRVSGLKGFNKKRPWLFLNTIKSNTINYLQSKGLKNQSEETAHLVAIVSKC